MPRDEIKGSNKTVTDFLEILQCSTSQNPWHTFSEKKKRHWIRENLSLCTVLEGNTYKMAADMSLCHLAPEGSVCMFVSRCLYNTGYTTAAHNTTCFTVKENVFSPGKGSRRSILHFVHPEHHHRGGTKCTPSPSLDKPGLSTFQSFTEQLSHTRWDTWVIFFHTSTQNFFLALITTKYLSKLDCKTRYGMSAFTQEEQWSRTKFWQGADFPFQRYSSHAAGSSVLQQAAGVKEQRRVDTKPFCFVLLLRCTLMPPVQHWTLVLFRTWSYSRQLPVMRSECWWQMWSLKLWSQCSLKIRGSKYNDKTELKNKKKKQMTRQKTFCRIKEKVNRKR